MTRKKMKVIEINKKEEKILLEKEENKFLLFLRKYRLLILLTLLILSLTVLSLGIILTVKNLKNSEEPVIKLVDVETNLSEDNVISINSYLSTDDSGAKSRFYYGFSNGMGEVLTIKVVDTGKYTIKYYSDGTAIKIMKEGNKVTRVLALDDGSYGIYENGNIDINAKTIETLIKETKDYSWGTVTYFMDGTADISSLKKKEIINIFVRNANDINENYISSSKVTYSKEIVNIGSHSKVTYYYDGSILVDDGNNSYIVRNSDDINISGSNISYPNNNNGVIIDTKIMNDGRKVLYYSDGGAIIMDGSRTISVRKSNSIVIKNNKIYEIVDSIYVTKSKESNNVTIYTNGGCVVKYDNTLYYVSESGNVKYNDDGSIKEITGKKEKLESDNNFTKENVKLFDETAVITTDEYIAIVSKDDVIFDTNGKFKEIREDKIDEGSSFIINNNTSEELNYRIILDQSDKTDLNTKYIKYQILAKDKYVEPSFLNDAYWYEDDLLKEVKLMGDNYILLESTLEPLETINVNLMLWTDYETITNAMQDKYFYGTIRVYAWTIE